MIYGLLNTEIKHLIKFYEDTMLTSVTTTLMYISPECMWNPLQMLVISTGNHWN